MITITTDILINGGGPSGCVTALTAQRFGLKSVLLDRSSFPRDKICGDGILVKEVESIFSKLGLDLISSLNNKTNFYEAKEFLIKDDKGHTYNHEVKCVINKRYVFDTILWDLLEENSCDNVKFDNSKIESIIKIENVYQTICTINGDKYQINSNYIIGADGYSSFVRRKFFPQLSFPTRIASRCYLNLESSIQYPTAMYFDKKIIPGYFWCFNLGNNEYNTGVYLTSNKENDVFDLHEYFVKKYLNTKIDKTEIKTWPIPNNTSFNDLVFDGSVILTGDAAGLCDSTFGHGIDNAITSGFLSIFSIVESLKPNAKYPLGEIYRYYLNLYIGHHLTVSKNFYQEMINEDSENFMTKITQMLKQI